MSRGYPASCYEIDEDYFLWLCGLVDAEDPDSGYLGIMHHLYELEFSDRTAKLIPNDDNRIDDGMEMRRRFAEETLYDDYECIEGPCSVLEMIIALSVRIDEAFGYEDQEFWFWEMMNNLGLDEFTDNVYYDRRNRSEIDHILDTFLDRRYNRKGEGGLFPLKNPERDQRKVEIWNQMNAYLVEKYMS